MFRAQVNNSLEHILMLSHKLEEQKRVPTICQGQTVIYEMGIKANAKGHQSPWPWLPSIHV